MDRKMAPVAVLASLCAFLWAAMAPAQAVKVTEQVNRQIQGENYQASLASDGCLTNLKVMGDEFLMAGPGGSRGSYFYVNAPLTEPAITSPEANVIVAKGDRSTIRYEFQPRGMVWTLENTSDAKMSFFLTLQPSFKTVANGQGETKPTPVEMPWTHTVWENGFTRITIDGSDRIWGPWSEAKLQVVEVNLEPGQSRPLTFEFSLVVPERPALELFSPRNLQVFQRQSRDRGRFLLSGHCYKDADAVEYRVTGKSLGGELDGKWQKVAFDVAASDFSARLPLAAGGWYKLEARALKDGQVVAESVVDQVGMGEVFVGAGQSNSTNCGQFPTQETSGMVSSFSGSTWQMANDPQPGPHDNTQGGSFWPSFGDAMYAKYHVPIGVAVTGHGGTSVNQWLPGHELGLFAWTLNRINELGPNGFRAVLWHQGESDVGGNMPTDEYVLKMTYVIEEMHKAAGWDFPWIVAKVSYINPDWTHEDRIRNAHQELWDKKIALEGPDTDTLMGDNRDYEGKGIHFSPKGLKAHGELWAEKVGAWLDPLLTYRAMPKD